MDVLDTYDFFEMHAEDCIMNFDGRRRSSVSHEVYKCKFKFRSKR
jgi:hypothetical protein